MTDAFAAQDHPPNVAPDAFFVLRDVRDLFVQQLDQLARLAGVANAAREAFARAAGSAFDTLAAGTAQGGFGETAGLTASRISLVGNDALELEIRIGELLHRLKDNERIDHWRVQLRLTQLLRRPAMTAADNPLGFSALEEGLWALCDAIEGDLDRKLDALGRLEEQLQLTLPELYAELNTQLERQGVELAQPALINRPSRAPGGAALSPRADDPASSTPATLAANPLAVLQQAVGQQNGAFAPGGGSPQFVGAPGGAFPSLHWPGASGAGTGDAALNASALIMLNQLMERLRGLEALRERPAALHSRDLDEALAGPASVALDTLAMIFDGIFAAPDLPEPVKAAIGRLQLPLVRIAITDPGFFTDPAHPARQLINGMARAARGLAPGSGPEHPVCAALADFAEAARQALDKAPLDASGRPDCSPHQARLDTLIAEREAALDSAVTPYLALVEEHAQRMSALRHSAKWLHACLAAPDLPGTVADFLTTYWQRVMQEAYLVDRGTGPQWQAASASAADLVWSVAPKATPEERQKLAALIPNLIRRINTGLDQLAAPAAERTPYLDAFFELQTAALRNRNLPPTPRRSAPPAELAAPPTGVPQILERQGKLVQYFASNAPAGSCSLTPGDWIAFNLPDGERLHGRYCGRNADQTHALLYNPDWGYAVALPGATLEAQVQDGSAERLGTSALFDRAAQSALAAIRGR